MKIGFIGSSGSGMSFVIDHVAQLIVKSGKRVKIVDWSESKSIYRKYTLKKQQFVRGAAEPMDDFIIAVEEDDPQAYDFVFYDLGTKPLKDAAAYDMICAVCSQDHHKYEKLSASLRNHLEKMPDKLKLIVNQAVHGKVNTESVIAGSEDFYDHICAVDFDTTSYATDLYGRMTGDAGVQKLSRHTKQQLYKIASELFGVKEKLRRLK